MPDNERELNAKVKISTDKSSVEDTKRNVVDVEQSLRKSEKTAAELAKRFNQMREASERLTRVGMMAGMVGAAITGPLLLGARSYTQQVGMAEATSRRWLSATQRMEQAQIRLGRETAEVIVPYLEKAANLVEDIASFIEQHPEVVKAALVVGAGGAGIGTLAVAAGQLMNVVGSMGSLATMLGAGKAAGGAGGVALGAGAAGAGAVAGGVGLGYLGAKALGYQGGPLDALKEIVGVPSQMAATGLGIVGLGLREIGLIGDDTAQQLGQAVHEFGTWGGVLEKAADKAEEAGKKTEDWLTSRFGTSSQAALEAFVNYEDQNTAARSAALKRGLDSAQRYHRDALSAEQGFQSRRAELIEDFATQQAEAYRDFVTSQQRAVVDYERTRASLIVNYQQQEAQAEAEYYQQRTDQAQDYSLEIQRAEEDHQREMRRLQEDHNYRMQDAVRARDARAVFDEMRSYETTRRRAEEDYRSEASRKSQDYARQVADLEESFSEQRESRLAQFEQQLDDQRAQFEQQQADAEENFQEQQRRAEEQHRKRLSDLERQFRDEQNEKKRQFFQSMLDLRNQYNQERQLRTTEFQLYLDRLAKMSTNASQYYADIERRFMSFMGNLQTIAGGGTPIIAAGRAGVIGMAAGGYAAGIVRTGEAGREFILNAATTRALEQSIGSLTQDKVLKFGGHSEHTIRFEGVPPGISQAGLEQVVREVLTHDIRDYITSRN